MTAYLEPGALTGPGLLLDGHDLEHLVLQTRTQEEVDDLRLLQEKTNRFDHHTVHDSCEIRQSTHV